MTYINCPNRESMPTEAPLSQSIVEQVRIADFEHFFVKVAGEVAIVLFSPCRALQYIKVKVRLTRRFF